MSRILALDIGEKRIGIAISDESATIAQPLMVLNRLSQEKDLSVINELVRKYKVEKIVLGYPFTLKGLRGKSGKMVEEFIDSLKKGVSSLVIWDERFSTAVGRKVLVEADLSRQKQKKVIDKMAAALVLQSFLDRQKVKSKGDKRRQK